MIPCYNEATSMKASNLELDIRLAAQTGFRSIEVRKEKLVDYLREGHTLEEARDLYLRYGLKPTCINALQGIYMDSRQNRISMRDSADFLCYCGRVLGCEKLEYIAPYNLPIQDPDELEAYTVDSLRTLSDIAAPYGVKLAVEYMGIPGNSIQTFNDALRIINTVGRDNVGILLDTWHHYAWRSKPEDILKATEGQVFMVHISDCPERALGTAVRAECIWPGEGAAPVLEDLHCLKQVGYTGEISMEIFDPSIQATDPAVNIPKAYGILSELIQKI